MKKINNEKELLNSLYDLILNDLTSDIEREILLSAKNRLEQGTNIQRVVSDLKVKLSPLARQQELSKDVVKFYLELSQQFLDRGQRGMWIFP